MEKTDNKLSPGAMVALIAAAALLICFFLPWVEFNMLIARGTVTGFEMATGGGRGQGVPALLLAMAGAAATIIIGLATLRRKPSGSNAGGLLVLVALAAAGAIAYFYFQVFNELHRSTNNPFEQLGQALAREAVTVLFGAHGALLSSLGILAGGVMELGARKKKAGPPSAVATSLNLGEIAAPPFAPAPVFAPPPPSAPNPIAPGFTSQPTARFDLPQPPPPPPAFNSAPTPPPFAFNSTPTPVTPLSFWQCSKCGVRNRAEDNFCTGCGARFTPPAPPAPTASTASAAYDPLIGQTLDGKYRVEARLGAGGMGTVYRATRLMIGDTVALKVLHAEQVADPSAPERFRREAQAAARLKHPNAVMIHDFGISREGLVYLVMELVEGQSLRQLIAQHGPCTPAIAAEIMNQACAALDEAHRQQIVHRDLKPDNIMVNTAGGGFRVKLLDFGIAKMRDQAATAGSLTQTGNVMGTPHYMSPEQCLGEELDSRSDIYSLGVVLYEMLTGVVPFNATVSTAVAVQHVSQAPPPLRSINPYIPQSVEALVLHALAKQRDARPRTAGALAQMLAAAGGGVIAAFPSGATPVSYPPPAPPPAPIPVAAPPSSGASNMMPTMEMSSMRRDSGHSTPIAGNEAAAPLFGQTGAGGATAGGKRTLIIAGAAVVVAVALVAGYFLLFNAKRAILAEARKGNLVTPAGKSAYDRYLESNLSDKDRAEVGQEVTPLLEAKGSEVIRQIVVDGYSPSKAECDDTARIYEWLDKLSKQNTYESRQHYFKGRAAFDSKDFSGAENEIRRAVGLDPNFALAANHMGRVYFQRKDYVTTQGWYQRAIDIEPNWMVPRINLCVLAVENLKNPYLGEQACRNVLQLDQNKASGYYFLGRALEGQQRKCDALAAYQTALEKASGATSPGFNVDGLSHAIPKLQNQCGD